MPFNYITEIVISAADLVFLIIQQDKNLVYFLMITHLYGNIDINEVN
jgi:hypothetical protein